MKPCLQCRYFKYQYSTPPTPPYLLQLNLLCIELLLLPLQLVSLFLEVKSFQVEVLFLLSKMLLKLPHLLVCVSLVLLQGLRNTQSGCDTICYSATPFDKMILGLCCS